MQNLFAFNNILENFCTVFKSDMLKILSNLRIKDVWMLLNSLLCSSHSKNKSLALFFFFFCEAQKLEETNALMSEPSHGISFCFELDPALFWIIPNVMQ